MLLRLNVRHLTFYLIGGHNRCSCRMSSYSSDSERSEVASGGETTSISFVSVPGHNTHFLSLIRSGRSAGISNPIHHAARRRYSGDFAALTFQRCRTMQRCVTAPGTTFVKLDAVAFPCIGGRLVFPHLLEAEVDRCVVPWSRRLFLLILAPDTERPRTISKLPLFPASEAGFARPWRLPLPPRQLASLSLRQVHWSSV